MKTSRGGVLAVWSLLLLSLFSQETNAVIRKTTRLGSSRKMYLYDRQELSNSNLIEEIKTKTFWQELMAENIPQVVLFYSPSCPACITFTSKYEKFASLVKKKLFASTRVSPLYAVSCEALPSVCQSAKVMSFPQLKVTLDNGETWQVLSKSKLHSVAALQQILAREKTVGGEAAGADVATTKNGSSKAVDSPTPVLELKPKNKSFNVLKASGGDKEDKEGSVKEALVVVDEPKDVSAPETVGINKNSASALVRNLQLRDGDDGDEGNNDNLPLSDGDNDEEGDKEDEDLEEDANVNEDLAEGNDEDADDNGNFKDEGDAKLSEGGDDSSEDDAAAGLGDDGELDEDKGVDTEEDENKDGEFDEDKRVDTEEDESKDGEFEDENKDGEFEKNFDEEDNNINLDEESVQNDNDSDELEEEDAIDEEDHAFADAGIREDSDEKYFKSPQVLPGAAKAKLANPSVDPMVKGEIREYILKNKASHGSFLLRQNRLRNKRIQHLKKQVPKEGATDTMVAHRPQTQQNLKKRQALLDAIEKQKGRKVRDKVEKRWNLVLQSEGNIRLPFKKDLKKPRFVERVPLVNRAVAVVPEEALMLDTMLAFKQELQFGVYKGVSSGPLSFARKRALRDWLELLSVTLPEEWSIHDILEDLLSNLERISKSESNLQAVLQRHTMSRTQFSRSCGKSGSGLTCGFWKLLHTMSIGLAEHRGGQTLIDSGMRKPDTRLFSPSQAAAAVRDYMDHFFLCGPCADHFIKTYEDCSKNRRCDRLANDPAYATDADWKEMAKWMWEVHNDISVRVAGEKAIKKTNQRRASNVPVISSMAALYPTMDDCVKCFADDGSWNEDAVFLFLEYEYWPSLTLDPKMNRLLQFEEGFDSEGIGLFWFLLVLGGFLAYYLVQDKRALSQTILRAKSASLQVRGAGQSASQKRND